MTYKEKLQEEHGTLFWSGCPHDHGYEERPCFYTHCASMTCEECWKREMKEKERDMKYKVGDTVYLKGIVDIVDECDREFDLHVDFGEGGAEWFNHNTIRTSDLLDKTYEQGLQDAWELAKKLWVPTCYGGIPFEIVEKVFGCSYFEIAEDYTVQEALAKLKEYEDSQEIKAGDVVEYSDSKVEIWITYANGDLLNGIKVSSDEWGRCGSAYSGIYVKDCKKTGKHIDIAGLLEQIRG